MDKQQDKKEGNMGASAAQTGLSQVEPVPVSPADAASIPSAATFLRAHREIQHYLHNRLIHRTAGRDPKLNGYCFAEVSDWQLRRWAYVFANAASAMSARSGETAGLAPQDASAVPQADAQVTPSPTTNEERAGGG